MKIKIPKITWPKLKFSGFPKLRLGNPFHKHHTHKKGMRIVLIGLALVGTAGAIVAIFIYNYIFADLPSVNSLKDYKVMPLSTHIYDRNHTLLYEIYRDQNRTPVSLKDLPKHVAQATIAIEDKDFYKHSGISIFSGMVRAAKDMLLGHNLQGGSTLTQQLVKGTLLTPERTVKRKLKEIVLALRTEQTFTKDQILELYLNQVPYGGSAYGIEEAAGRYFDKQAKNLTLSEAALLAGLPQAPSLYSPYSNLDAAVRRRNTILDLMQEQGYITKKQRDAAKKEKLVPVPPKNPIKAPHFVFYVRSELEKMFDLREVEEGGLKVYTTLDLDLQASAEAILKSEIEKIKKYNVTNGAMLVTRPPTGEILSMVGSTDYFATPSGSFNVTTALRQPGSSIKPLVYAVGIDQKIVTPASIFLDVRTCFNPAGAPEKYCPGNYDGSFHGPVRLRTALGSSYNIPAVKMTGMIGVHDFIASASALTISSFTDPDRYGLSIGLGGGEVRMTEMTQAFSSFANQGKVRRLNSILKVVNKHNEVIYEFKDPNFIADVKSEIKSPNFLAIPGKQVFSRETAYLISHILLDNSARAPAFGTASELVIPKKAVSVKTGTTNDLKDNWTIGYTPNFLTAVWVGNNDNSQMKRGLVSGITGAAPIWNKTMKMLLQNQQDLWPVKPDTIVSAQICSDTGEVMSTREDGSQSCAVAGYDYYVKGTENAMRLFPTRKVIPVYRDQDIQAPKEDPNTEMKEKTVLEDKWGSVYCLDCAHPPPPEQK